MEIFTRNRASPSHPPFSPFAVSHLLIVYYTTEYHNRPVGGEQRNGQVNKNAAARLGFMRTSTKIASSAHRVFTHSQHAQVGEGDHIIPMTDLVNAERDNGVVCL